MYNIKGIGIRIKNLDNNIYTLLNTIAVVVDVVPPSPPPPTHTQVHLDASNNKITDLPIGAANFWMHSLERLILSHNSITEISRNITELNHLTLLDLSHNRIKTLPPTSAWSGNRLNKLNLSFNQLTRLTQEPGKEAAALAPPKEEHKYASVSMIG